MTTCDILWPFLSLSSIDITCHKTPYIIIKFVIKCHDNLRQFTTIYDIFCPVPFPPYPFGSRRKQDLQLERGTVFKFWAINYYLIQFAKVWGSYAATVLLSGSGRRPEIPSQRYPVLPFLVFLEKGQENHQKNKDFLSLPNLKSLEKKGKTLKKTRNSSQGEKTRNSKKQGKEGQVRGWHDRVVGDCPQILTRFWHSRPA